MGSIESAYHNTQVITSFSELYKKEMKTESRKRRKKHVQNVDHGNQKISF